jgi:hypothetical protein
MEEIIGRLSEIESAASAIMDEAGEKKKAMSDELERMKKEWSDNLEKQTQEKIEQLRKEMGADIENSLKLQKEKAKQYIKKMHELYNENHDSYVNLLFDELIKVAL